jgi:hypothetical protein
MSIARSIGCLACVALVVGCGTIEDNAWTRGVSREDAMAIRQIVLAAHPGCEIYSYLPDENRVGHIYCSTSCETYLLRRTSHGWKLVTGIEVITV